MSERHGDSPECEPEDPCFACLVDRRHHPTAECDVFVEWPRPVTEDVFNMAGWRAKAED